MLNSFQLMASQGRRAYWRTTPARHFVEAAEGVIAEATCASISQGWIMRGGRVLTDERHWSNLPIVTKTLDREVQDICHAGS